MNKTKSEPHIRMLNAFRKFTAIPEIQLLIPGAYQLYLLCCMGFGFDLNKKEMALIFGGYVLLDVLMFIVMKLLAKFKPMTVGGQVLCAANLLLTAGISGQSVFANRFYSITSYASSPFELVKSHVTSLGIYILVGAVLGAVCFFVCMLLKSRVPTESKRENKSDNLLVCYLLFVLFVAACAGFLILLFSTGNGTDSSNQWFGGFQPGEFLKFGFFIVLAFASGVESGQKGWIVLKAVIQFGSLGALVLYYGLLGEFGSLLVIAASFVLFLIVSNRNWLYTGVLLLVALCIGIPTLGVILHSGNEYIEEKYTLTLEEKKDLNYRAEMGLLEEGEAPYIEPESSFFDRQYEKIYMRFMIVKDVDGTDPSILPGVREALREEYGYQPAAALKAIGISGIVPFNAPVFHYVTHADTDYIYTSVLQCGGLVSVIVMLFAYLLLADSAFSLISSNCDMINRYLVFSMITSILVQMIINILGVNNLVPLTGIPLPFVSRGGSSVVVCIMMLAVVFFADFDYVKKKNALKDEWRENNDNQEGAIVYEGNDFIVENERR